MIICAAPAFDGHAKGGAYGEKTSAFSASDFFLHTLHLLIVLPLRPRIRPDMRLRARGLTVSRKRRRILRTVPFHRVGPWSGGRTPGRWGRLQSPPPLPCIFSHLLFPSSAFLLRQPEPGACLVGPRDRMIPVLQAGVAVAHGFQFHAHLTVVLARSGP